MNDYNLDGFVPLFDESEARTTDGKDPHESIYLIANAFLTLSSMTHKKLQKLCYYAKAWYLALYDKNLIEEPFEAWVHGAVQPDLYQKYRSFGFSNIPMYFGDDIPEEFMDFAKQIYYSYGDLDGCTLERLNHQEDPWKNARGSLKPWQASTNIISEEDMKAYYRKEKEDEEKQERHEG